MRVEPTLVLLLLILVEVMVTYVKKKLQPWFCTRQTETRLDYNVVLLIHLKTGAGKSSFSSDTNEDKMKPNNVREGHNQFIFVAM